MTCRFQHLAPVERGDEKSVYIEALKFCFEQKDVRNIAITGPYGAGKSSVIKSFKRFSGDKLDKENTSEISLAQFEKREIKEEEIEISIIQNLLYGTGDETVPYSKIIKPREPRKLKRKALLAIGLMLIPFLAIFVRSDYLSISLINELVALISLTVAFGILLYYAVSGLIRYFHSNPIKSFSLKDVGFEISPHSVSKFNFYIDEILYFFKSTKCKNVIFEDLDRFDSVGIYVKLRELNQIINSYLDDDSEEPKEPVRFFYALKDSLFTGESRTKFFDFIIPVVPIVSPSNSLAIIEKRASVFPDKFHPRFLKMISGHLNDARIIHNIFNEFQIYISELNSNDLDYNRLLAMVLYKNYYGWDFESLHFNKGLLHGVIEAKRDLLAKERNEIEKKILNLNSIIRKSEQDSAKNLDELVAIYLARITQGGPANAIGIYVNESYIPFNSIKTVEDFYPIVKSSGFQYVINGNSRPSGKRFSFSDIETSVGAEEKFEQRKSRIERFVGVNSSSLRAEVQQLTDSLALVGKKSIDTIIHLIEPDLTSRYKQEFYRKYGSQGAELTYLDNSYLAEESWMQDSRKIFNDKLEYESKLFCFLVESGYLGEDYEIYTSAFRSRACWTRRDAKLHQSIVSRTDPLVTFVIDNPVEVYERLRVIDFGAEQCLNIYLINYIFSESSDEACMQAITTLIKANFKQKLIQEFLYEYLHSELFNFDFLDKISVRWPDFLKELVVTTEENNYHPSNISRVLYVASANWILNQDYYYELTSYLNAHLHEVFADDMDLFILKELAVSIERIDLIDKNSKIYEFLVEHKLFFISYLNFTTILERQSKEFNIDSSSLVFSFLQLDRGMYEFIYKNAAEFITNVASSHESYRNEDEDCLLRFLISDGISNALKLRLIRHQHTRFQSLAGLTTEVIKSIVSSNKLMPSWKTVLFIFELEDLSKEYLTNILNDNDFVIDLVSTNIAASEQRIRFEQWFLELKEISIESYSKIISALNIRPQKLPVVDKEKMIFLVEEGRIGLKSSTFASCEAQADVQVLMVEKNQMHFHRIFDRIKADFSAEFYKLALSSSRISRTIKMKLLCQASLNSLVEGSEVSPVLVTKELLKQRYSKGFDQLISTLLRSVNLSNYVVKLFHYSGTKIPMEDRMKLLNAHIQGLKKHEIKEIILGWETFIREIVLYPKRPLIPASENTLILLKSLRLKGVIGKFNVMGNRVRVNTKLID